MPSRAPHSLPLRRNNEKQPRCHELPIADDPNLERSSYGGSRSGADDPNLERTPGSEQATLPRPPTPNPELAQPPPSSSAHPPHCNQGRKERGRRTAAGTRRLRCPLPLHHASTPTTPTPSTAPPPSADAVRRATAPTSSTPSATPPLRPRRRRPRRLLRAPTPATPTPSAAPHCSDRASASWLPPSLPLPSVSTVWKIWGEKPEREGRERGTETDSWAPLSDYE